MNCHIEIYLDGRWQIAATFEPYPTTLDKETEGECHLEYDVDYAVENLHNPNAELIPGLTVGFELFRFKSWPPFLIDLLPSGAGRRAWIRRMQVTKDGPQVDWHLLIKGASNPPGRLRIAEAVFPPPPDQFKNGFPRRDIIEQREDFLEYAAEQGAHVAGAFREKRPNICLPRISQECFMLKVHFQTTKSANFGWLNFLGANAPTCAISHFLGRHTWQGAFIGKVKSMAVLM